jgi:hypothetical protein
MCFRIFNNGLVVLSLFTVFAKSQIFGQNYKRVEASSANNVSARYIQGVSAKTFKPNISVISQRIFIKFNIPTDILDGEGSIKVQ